MIDINTLTHEEQINCRRAMIAIAACLNSTMLYSPEHILRAEAVRETLLMELEVYFEEPDNPEVTQFDRDTTLEFVRGEPIVDLVLLLHMMGKSPYSAVTTDLPPGEMWQSFVRTQANAIERLGKSVSIR